MDKYTFVNRNQNISGLKPKYLSHFYTFVFKIYIYKDECVIYFMDLYFEIFKVLNVNKC